jgi:hypothetical protein
MGKNGNLDTWVLHCNVLILKALKTHVYRHCQTRVKAPQKEHLETVQKTWQACERFVMLGCITLGLLQLVEVTRYQTFLRSYSSTYPFQY